MARCLNKRTHVLPLDIIGQAEISFLLPSEFLRQHTVDNRARRPVDVAIGLSEAKQFTPSPPVIGKPLLCKELAQVYMARWVSVGGVTVGGVIGEEL